MMGCMYTHYTCKSYRDFEPVCIIYFRVRIRLRAMEDFLLLLTGALEPSKCSHSAITWSLPSFSSANQMIQVQHSLYTQDGTIIPYENYCTAVRDLGFKTSLDLTNDEQVQELQHQLDCKASRLSELNQMSSCCAFLIDQAVQVPATSYACSFLPITAKTLSNLDRVASQVVRSRFHLSSKFPEDLLHACPLGIGRLGLFHRVLLDRWAILASHICCPGSSFSYNTITNLINQLRTSINLSTVEQAPLYTSVLPLASEVNTFDPQLRYCWLYPLCQWLHQHSVLLIQGPPCIHSDTLNALCGFTSNSTSIKKAQHMARTYPATRPSRRFGDVSDIVKAGQTRQNAGYRTILAFNRRDLDRYRPLPDPVTPPR